MKMDERVVNQTVVACRAILNVSLTQSVPQNTLAIWTQIQTSQPRLHRRPLSDACCNDTDIGIPVVVPLHSNLNISTLQKQIYKPCPTQKSVRPKRRRIIADDDNDGDDNYNDQSADEHDEFRSGSDDPRAARLARRAAQRRRLFEQMTVFPGDDHYEAADTVPVDDNVRGADTNDEVDNDVDGTYRAVDDGAGPAEEEEGEGEDLFWRMSRRIINASTR